MAILNLFIIIALGFILTVADSMRFDLKAGHAKCIAEDIRTNSMTVGKYNVISAHEPSPLPDFYGITVEVTSPYGNTYHHGEHVVSGNFAFTAAEAGDYTTCFWANQHNPQLNLTVDFDWRTGVAAKDWSSVAKKGQIGIMELELRKLYDTVNLFMMRSFIFVRGMKKCNN